MKKIISAGLAAILAASALSTAAFAEDFTVTATSTLAKPAIKVTMPKSMAFVFNPYGLTVDLKGKVTTEQQKDGDTVLNNAVVVPSYQYDTTTAGKGWKVDNQSGAVLKAAIYAYAINADSAEFKVFDEGDTTNAKDTDATKILAVTIKATGASSTATTVKMQNAELAADTTIWKEANKASGGTAFKVDQFTAEKPLYVTMSGKTFNKDKLTWAETDVANINFIFSFDFADSQTVS